MIFFTKKNQKKIELVARTEYHQPKGLTKPISKGEVKIPLCLFSVILSGSVRPRIVSFGEVLAVPWKSNLVLDCMHVGKPLPTVQWIHKNKPVVENSKHQVRGI